MPRTSSKDIDGFIKTWNAINEQYGTDVLKKTLIELLPTAQGTKDLIENKIISEVCLLYSVPSRDIFSSKNVPAKIMVIILFYKCLNIKHIEISQKLNEDRSTITKKIRQFIQVKSSKDIDPMSAYGKIFTTEFMNNYDSIEKKITHYTKTLKNNK